MLYLALDLETPGIYLDAAPFEIAVILTDANFTELARYETVLRPTEQSMRLLYGTPHVVQMHAKSGLLEELLSEHAHALPTLADAEKAILALIDEHGPGEEVALAGGGVARFDGHVIRRQMPELAERLVYWEQDTSSARRLFEQVAGRPIIPENGEKAHRAMSDIEADLRCLRAFAELYREAAAAPEEPMTPQTRVLSCIAMTDAYIQHDADEALGTRVGPVYDIRALLTGPTRVDIAVGYMDLTAQLATELAEVKGTTVAAVLEDARRRTLAAV